MLPIASILRSWVGPKPTLGLSSPLAFVKDERRMSLLFNGLPVEVEELLLSGSDRAISFSLSTKFALAIITPRHT